MVEMTASHFSIGKILDIRDELDSGIVDQNVERAEFLFSRADHVRDLGRFGHISRRIECFDAKVLLSSGADFFDFSFVAKTVEHDVGAFARQ